MDIEEIEKHIKGILSEKRYLHSVGTMRMARKLAHIYGENEDEAAFAGLIHDIAKELTKEEILEYLKTHNIEIDEIEKENLGLVHAKIGACIAEEKFNASKKVQNAILYHTTGNSKMDQFAKIIYVADKIEENRNYDGVEELREIAKKDLDKVIYIITDFVIKKTEMQGKVIHPDTLELRNMLQNNKNT